MTFAVRVWINFIVFVVVSLVSIFIYRAYAISLFRFQYISGWLLFLSILFLALYSLRKKLSFLPLGASSTWLQIHLLIGWLTIVFFLLHIEFRVPNGFLEVILSLFYVLVAGSGIFGLWISRGFAPRITQFGLVSHGNLETSRRKIGEEVIFERIPQLSRGLGEEARALALRSVGEAKSTTISDYYADRLMPYFLKPRNYWLHLIESNRPLQLMLNEIHVLRRYLNEKEQEIFDGLADLIQQKNELDYQYAHQSMLKRWLFFHIPFTYAMLIFTLLHIIVAYAFSGGAQ
ncbi:MAG: hypothetical protein QF787_17120 [Nitrospinota bacterium]|nr:hypothetical protein [Nitrospinota bacterium]